MNLDGMSGTPLRGTKVLEFGHIISAPFCTLMLAALGADVVKVESPGKGDDLRSIGRYKGREDKEDYFNCNNYSKRGITLDLKSEEGLSTARALIARADALVENFSTGTMARLGLGWEQARAINPRLVYCSISGYGQEGPYRDRTAVDNTIQAISGLMSVTGSPDGPPFQVGAPLADVLTSMSAAIAMLAALQARDRDGGAYIDLSMQDAMVFALGPRMGGVLHTGESPPRIGNENPMRVPSDIFETKDGKWVLIIVANDRRWAPLCRALRHEEWLDDPRFGTAPDRVTHRRLLNDMVQSAVRRMDAAELSQRLAAENVPFGPVNDYAGAIADPQIVARELVREVEHPTAGTIKVIAPPWLMNGSRGYVAPPPTLGQHNAEVLRDWLS